MFKRLGQCFAVGACVGLLCGVATIARAQETPAPVTPNAPEPPSATQPKTPPAATSPRAPKARPAVAVGAAEPRTPRPTPAPMAQRPALAPSAPKAPPPPRQVVTVVHRLSGWKLLAWLAVSGPPALEIDEFPSATDVHTNIVAGFVSNDGRSVMARLPQAEAELETFASPHFPPGFFSGEEAAQPTPPEFTLVSREGKRVKANFVGFDSATGLSLLEAEEPFVMFAGDMGHTETPSVGQRVHLYAPTPAPQQAGDSGQTDEEETIYLDMGRAEGRLVEVRRAPSGKPSLVTARAPRATPAWTGAVATSEAGAPLGIVAMSGANETRIVPVEDVRAAVERVRAYRAAVVPQPWLGVRGEAAFKSPLADWVKRGWKPELAQSLIQERKGVFLTAVAPDTPAFQSGLRPGDVIARVGDREVAGIEDLSMFLREAGVGSTLSFTVLRATTPSPLAFPVVLSGAQNPAVATYEAEIRAARSNVLAARTELNFAREEERRLRAAESEAGRNAAALAELAARRGKAEHQLMRALTQQAEAEMRVAQTRAGLLRPGLLSATAPSAVMFTRPLRASGLEVIGLTHRSASRLGAKGGVLVVSVLPGSAAEQCGLRAGDVIETAAGKLFSHAELRGILNNTAEPRLSLGVVRGATKMTVLLPLDEREEE